MHHSSIFDARRQITMCGRVQSSIIRRLRECLSKNAFKRPVSPSKSGPLQRNVSLFQNKTKIPLPKGWNRLQITTLCIFSRDRARRSSIYFHSFKERQEANQLIPSPLPTQAKTFKQKGGRWAQALPLSAENPRPSVNCRSPPTHCGSGTHGQKKEK